MTGEVTVNSTPKCAAAPLSRRVPSSPAACRCWPNGRPTRCASRRPAKTIPRATALFGRLYVREAFEEQARSLAARGERLLSDADFSGSPLRGRTTPPAGIRTALRCRGGGEQHPRGIAGADAMCPAWTRGSRRAPARPARWRVLPRLRAIRVSQNANCRRVRRQAPADS
jgi:hypothetical protein